MLDALFWWTGLIAWVAIAALLLWLAGEVVWGLIVAIDYVAWMFAIARTHRSPITWRKVPRAFVHQWGSFIGYRFDTTSSCTQGRWDGFRHWTVYPNTQSNESA